jgi:hypothetical protein
MWFLIWITKIDNDSRFTKHTRRKRLRNELFSSGFLTINDIQLGDIYLLAAKEGLLLSNVACNLAFPLRTFCETHVVFKLLDITSNFTHGVVQKEVEQTHNTLDLDTIKIQKFESFALSNFSIFSTLKG